MQEQYAIKKIATICKNLCAAFVPLFDKKHACFVSHFYGLYVGFERATLSPGTRLLCCKMALKENGALLGIAAHFHRLRRACKKRRCTFAMTAHLRERWHTSDCGVAIKVQRTRLRSTLHSIFKVRVRCICCILFDAHRMQS